MDIFTQEDHDWFEKVSFFPEQYKVVIDNDCIWVENIVTEVEDEPECLYTFSSYGYYFIHAVLNDMGINAEFC